MARMIPDSYAKDIASPGEPVVFNKLRDSSGTKDWVVLHSLQIAHNHRRGMGEADFVCIVPRRGIVVVEVKGHSSADFRNGQWYLGADAPTTRGPFHQAAEAMHAIRKFLLGYDATRDVTLGIIVTHCVIFTGVAFPQVQTLEWRAPQLIDAARLQSTDIGSLMLAVLDSEAAARPTQSDGTRFGGREVEAILRRLRPTFTPLMDARNAQAVLASELRRATDEQGRIIEAVSQIPRVLVQGPPGTGKSVLAVHEALRMVREGDAPDDRRVLVVCFNEPLSRALKAAANHPQVKVGTFHALCRELLQAGDGSLGDIQVGEFPAALSGRLDGLLAAEQVMPWDVLVVDEMQDLLKWETLDILERLVVGGLQNGMWRMFGDTALQSLFGLNDGAEQAEVMEYLSGMTFPVRLHHNCRNPQNVSTWATCVVLLPRLYTSNIRTSLGEVKMHVAADESGRLSLLRQLIVDRAFSPEDTVILSTRGNEDCLASGLLPSAFTFDIHAPHVVRASSIHRFKGLEARRIIVTDLVGDGFNWRALLFVALTRATERVDIIVDLATSNLIGQAYVQGTAS